LARKVGAAERREEVAAEDGGNTMGATMESRSSRDLEEVRRRSDLVQIVSAHTSLRRSGSRLAGLCPFHEEKTPSFYVDPQKQLWYCFGCKAGGDVFNFVEKTENLTFIEAARWLAQKAGITLRETSSAQRSQRNILLEINARAAEFFKRRLRANDGAAARAYLEQRKISEDSISAFGIGYAPPGWEQLFTFLRQQGFSAGDIAASGLCLPKQKGPGYYDRFRSRIMFPVCNAEGGITGFGGRALPGAETGDSPKYMNSPETAIFRKGQALYALNLARRAMQQAGAAIVVEGYFDCIACHQAGFKQTVATMGTALTSDQARLLRRHVERANVAFDADSAGFSATLRSAPMFENVGLAAQVIVLPRGKDPDALVRDDGAEALRQAVDKAIPMMECRLHLLEEQHGATGEDARQTLLRESVKAIAELPDSVEQQRWVRWLAERHSSGNARRVEALAEAIWKQLHRRRTPRRQGQQPAAAQPAPCDHAATRLLAEEQVLWALVSNDEIAKKWLPKMGPQLFRDEANVEILKALCELADKGVTIEVEAVRAVCRESGTQRIAELALREMSASERELQALVERLEDWESEQVMRTAGDRFARAGSQSPGDSGCGKPVEVGSDEYFARLEERAHSGEGEQLVREKTRLSKRLGRRSAGT